MPVAARDLVRTMRGTTLTLPYVYVCYVTNGKCALARTAEVEVRTRRRDANLGRDHHMIALPSPGLLRTKERNQPRLELSYIFGQMVFSLISFPPPVAALRAKPCRRESEAAASSDATDRRAPGRVIKRAARNRLAPDPKCELSSGVIAMLDRRTARPSSRPHAPAPCPRAGSAG